MIWSAVLSYLLSIFILLSAIYWFLINNGFTESNFLIASVGVLIVALGWGYILATELLAPKKNMDERFTHLSREILHELNIPLATIQANTTMLKKNLVDEKSQKRLNRIKSASIRLLRLYDELVYSINREIYTIEKEEFSLKELLHERTDILQAFGRNPFDINIHEQTLYADKIGFEQMIDNLLNNAMKYSNKESLITISHQENSLVIQDRGIGIDESLLVEIFERYYQADKNHHGQGIGLALVKKYCDEMKIDITLHSIKNEGTRITLDLRNVII